MATHQKVDKWMKEKKIPRSNSNKWWNMSNLNTKQPKYKNRI